MHVALALLLFVAQKDAPKDVSKDADFAKPINLEKLNSNVDDTDPYLRPDGLGLFFSSNRNFQYEIFLAKRSSAMAQWSAPNVFGTLRGADMRGPFIYKEFLYFAADIVSDEKLRKLKNFDLYKRLDEGAPIPFIGISEREDEAKPFITAGGTEFYFSKKMKDGWTLFVANGPVPGPIGKPRDLGFPPNFSHASLTASGLTMYLQGPLEDGRLGIYKATRTKPGAAWSKPEPLTKLNHPDAKTGDQSPCISADGLRLYFASDRPGGKGKLDLWMMPLDKLK